MEQNKHKKRKNFPIYSGVIKYFPKALAYVALVSKIGNDQHNPGKELFWDRTKSKDHLNALTRHLTQCGNLDDDGVYHDAKVAWRALGNLEELLEKNNFNL